MYPKVLEVMKSGTYIVILWPEALYAYEKEKREWLFKVSKHHIPEQQYS